MCTGREQARAKRSGGGACALLASPPSQLGCAPAKPPPCPLQTCIPVVHSTPPGSPRELVRRVIFTPMERITR